MCTHQTIILHTLNPHDVTHLLWLCCGSVFARSSLPLNRVFLKLWISIFIHWHSCQSPTVLQVHEDGMPSIIHGIHTWVPATRRASNLPVLCHFKGIFLGQHSQASEDHFLESEEFSWKKTHSQVQTSRGEQQLWCLGTREEDILLRVMDGGFLKNGNVLTLREKSRCSQSMAGKVALCQEVPRDPYSFQIITPGL